MVHMDSIIHYQPRLVAFLRKDLHTKTLHSKVGILSCTDHRGLKTLSGSNFERFSPRYLDSKRRLATAVDMGLSER